MAGNPSRKKGKKNRKHGRNQKFCEAYARSHRAERNQLKALRRHLKHNPGDLKALNRVKELEAIL